MTPREDWSQDHIRDEHATSQAPAFYVNEAAANERNSETDDFEDTYEPVGPPQEVDNNGKKNSNWRYDIFNAQRQLKVVIKFQYCVYFYQIEVRPGRCELQE